MLSLSSLLLPLILAGRTAPPTPTTQPGVELVTGLPTRSGPLAPDMQGGPSGSGGTPQHLFGFGGSVGAGALGTGLISRYWFAKFVGLDFRFLLSSANQGLGVGTGGFSYELAPSVILNFTNPDTSRPVIFRPYVGGGVNHTRAGTNVVITTSPVSGSGEQIFGGVEVEIQQVGSLAISVEVIYNRRSQTLVNAGLPNNVAGNVSFVFYVK